MDRLTGRPGGKGRGDCVTPENEAKMRGDCVAPLTETEGCQADAPAPERGAGAGVCRPAAMDTRMPCAACWRRSASRPSTPQAGHRPGLGPRGTRRSFLRKAVRKAGRSTGRSYWTDAGLKFRLRRRGTIPALSKSAPASKAMTTRTANIVRLFRSPPWTVVVRRT